MKKAFLITILGFCFIGSANAAYLSDKNPVCISEDAFNRLYAAANHDDDVAIAKIMKTECLYLKDGTPIEKVVSQGWTSGVAHVKIYMKGSGSIIDLWTVSENLKSSK